MLLPGSGFWTLTEKVPAVVASPVAVSCVEETKVLARGLLARRTCAPETKLEPVTVRLKLPRLVEDGEMPVKVGVGFTSVTAQEPDLVESAELVAVTFTVLGEGRLAGAVYLPVESTVPNVEEPPVMEFTDQVTAVFEVPVTEALNVKLEPARMFAVAGETETEIEAGDAGGRVWV